MDDAGLINLMEQCNEFLALQAKLNEQLQAGRLEIRFSRLQSAGTPASMLYAPKDDFDASVTTSGSAHFVGATSAASATGPNSDAASHMRHRQVGKSNGGKAANVTEAVAITDPLTWFGDNPSPRIAVAQATFKGVVRLVRDLLDKRRQLEASLTSK